MSTGLPLANLRVLLGVSGGIAAYKACEFTRRLRDAGADVRVVLTENAARFVTAPASADIIARLANGMAGDLLTTLCLASAAPIAIAPAMNQLMWAKAA